MTARAAIDSNILVYAELEPETPRGITAHFILEKTALSGIIPAQALLEFLAVVRRRRPESLPSAFAKTETWPEVFEIAATTIDLAGDARRLMERHKFQVWDAVIWRAAKQAGAELFLSEDLQDGLVLDGIRVVNPFRLPESELEAVLS